MTVNKDSLQTRATYSYLQGPFDCNNMYLAGSIINQRNKHQGKEEKHGHKHPRYSEVSMNLQGRTESEKGD